MGTRQSTAKADPGAVGSPRRRERLLDAAAALMARQGFEHTTIRDVGRVSNLSLAGMYYYFKSKDDLLFQIQHRTFATLLARQEAVAEAAATPRRKLERLVQNHLRFFTEQTNEMKVCAFELESLKDDHYRTVEALRIRYFKILATVIRDILPDTLTDARRERLVRHYTLFIFGMLNWMFTWFDPERDTPVTELGREMIDLVLPGLHGDGAEGRR